MSPEPGSGDGSDTPFKSREDFERYLEAIKGRDDLQRRLEQLENRPLANNRDNQLGVQAFLGTLFGRELEMYEQMFRTLGEGRLEQLVRRLLPAYTKDAGNALSEWHLKTIRRWAMRRYAFCLAGQIHERLDAVAENGLSIEERCWLFKDFLLPRMGFALLLGYGVLLGAGQSVYWLGALCGGWYWAALVFCSCTIAALLHVNARHQLGRGPLVNGRTAAVCAICFTWIWLGVAGIALGVDGTNGNFVLHWAALSSVVAMLLGILGQFFFTGNRSIADPL